MPTIITGDMNDTPESEPLQIIRTHQGIISAAGPEEPPVTTHKYRDGSGMTTRTIDYVFYLNSEQ